MSYHSQYQRQTYPAFVCRKHKLKKFEVRPSKVWNLYFVYFNKKDIGYFEKDKSIRRDKNGRQIYFFINQSFKHKSNLNNPKYISHDKIGTISFFFNDRTEKWKIKYITINKIPEQFLNDRKVLIEKTENEHNDIAYD